MRAKLIKENFLFEENDTEQVIVTVRKGSGKNLKKLIEYMKDIGNPGHSFGIIVDPEDGERKKNFYWDGDGSDYIESVTIK